MSGMAGGHALENILGRSDQTADHGPAFTAAVGACSAFAPGGPTWRDLARGDVGVELLKAHMHLVRIKPLRSAAELPALKLLNDQPELVDLT